jgi:hypothetical protein
MVFKSFSPGYESVYVLTLEGVASQLRDRTCIIQAASVQKLASRLNRFVKKHGDAINKLQVLHVERGAPTTTNALESKNGIFKPFGRSAKFFLNLQRFKLLCAGVALCEILKSKPEATIKVQVPCNGPKSIWMTSDLLTFFPQ